MLSVMQKTKIQAVSEILEIQQRLAPMRSLICIDKTDADSISLILDVLNSIAIKLAPSDAQEKETETEA